MKNTMFFIIVLFCLGMNITIYGGDRDLSTPLSRLWGHWELAGRHIFYSEVSNAGEWGIILEVEPDKETIIKFMKKMEKDGKVTAQEVKKGLAKIDEIANRVSYYRYRFESQEPKENKIVIYRLKFKEGDKEFFGFDEIIIDKDGNKMKLVASRMGNSNTRFPYNPPLIFNFINTETSPSKNDRKLGEAASFQSTEEETASILIQNTMGIKEVAESIQIVWHDSIWVDKKGNPDEAVIVPSFTFKIKNTGSRPLQHVNFKCVFIFEESGENLTDGFIDTIKKPLAPGQVSDEIFVKGFFGYRATSKAAFIKNMANWKNIKVKIFIAVDEDHVDHFSDQGQVLLGVFPIQKKIAGIKNNY